MNKNEEIGIITEVGDLGLGYEPLTEEDKKRLEENKEKSNSKYEH